MIAAKRVRLDEIVGRLTEEKEEEPEGEELGESDTGNVLPSFFFDCADHSALFLYFVFFFFFFLDDSDGEDRRPSTRGGEDVDILCSWMEVGGNQLFPKRRHKGC